MRNVYIQTVSWQNQFFMKDHCFFLFDFLRGTGLTVVRRKHSTCNLDEKESEILLF